MYANATGAVQSYDFMRRLNGAAMNRLKKGQIWRRLQQDYVVDDDNPWICF